MTPPDPQELAAASRPLHGHGRIRPAELLQAAADWCREHDVSSDVYGTGALITDFESQVASLLGFEAARFMPSGTMAQLIALRVHCDMARLPRFGMHPTSHLELHERRGYSALHRLEAVLVGPRHQPMRAEHLEAVTEPLGALLTELPIREAGGQLPTWEELQALKAAARRRSIPLHLDGARLWECAPAYGRALHEITAGFDSCYVSFYKGIGALSGCMLLGSAALIEAASIWQRRQGGNLYTLLPNVVTARMLLERRLQEMPRWLEHARALAAALATVPGVQIVPDPPHVNLFHLILDLDPRAAPAARDRVARRHGIWLFGGVREAERPGAIRLELYVGEAASSLRIEEIRAAVADLLGPAP